MSLEMFYEKVAEALVAKAVRKIQAQFQTNRPVSRLVGREQFIYRIPVTHARLERKFQCVCVCREKQAPLLEVKVTIEFHRQCHKNLISAQCVNCSGSVVTINVAILTSKFPIVVSGSKYT
jgi:hypothetical protein